MKKFWLIMLVPMVVLLSLVDSSLGVDLIYYVEEGKSPDTYVGDIATDSQVFDSIPPNAHSLIRFTQLEQSVTDSSQLFRVAKKTGRLYTTQTLDTEVLCKHNIECYKIVKVAIRRAKTFMKILKIKVIIQDVNDHQPEFPEQKVNVAFEEDYRKGVKKSIPYAIDKDAGVLNSQVTYQLKKNINDPFTLSVSKSVDGMSDLNIVLEDMLDREVKDSYMIKVIATDGGSPPKQSVLDVHISVTDVNDNTPVFSQNVYNVSINNEHDKTTPIVVLSATDLDSGKNGRISYHLSSRTSELSKDHFSIDEGSGEIFILKTFPMGKSQSFELFVKATDEGNPPLSSIAKVLVNVINQQNNVPIIDVNFFSPSADNKPAISEDVEVGSFIAYVMVTDLDFGQNGDVTCDLMHDKFQLQSLGSKEYKITVINPVDRETEDHYEITINCQDNGSPPLRNEKTFSINVIDVNDVRPQFIKDTFKFWIYENRESQFPVGSVNATDPDLGTGGKLTYSLLTNSKHFLPFRITNDGLISTLISLDHEFQAVYKFKVFVKDFGIPSLNNTANIIVEVRDENDNAPHFTFPSINPYTLDVFYYPRHTNNITVLRASDSDSRENAFLKYEITLGNDKQLFSINHYTGLLSFTRVVTPEDAGSYELGFVVKDSGTPALSATTTLSLMLTVTNRTSDISNPIRSQSDEKVHQQLFIVIVLIAVAVSVPITAAMSICIIRCNGRRNASHRDGLNPPCKCVTEHGNYMCPSQQPRYWPDDVAQSTDPELTRSLTRRSKRELQQGGEQGNGQKTVDGMYQVS